MAFANLPPGFRFHPTDEELVNYYLTRKICKKEIQGNFIPELDLYKCEPWDISEKSSVTGTDWYFFSPRDKKYPNGGRTNRATQKGYWKATGKDRPICSGKKGPQTGMKKTLVFYQGRAPRGVRTDWIMHEYRLESERGVSKPGQDAFVLCRVFNKKGDAKDSSPASVLVASTGQKSPDEDNILEDQGVQSFPVKLETVHSDLLDEDSHNWGDTPLTWSTKPASNHSTIAGISNSGGNEMLRQTSPVGTSCSDLSNGDNSLGNPGNSTPQQFSDPLQNMAAEKKLLVDIEKSEEAAEMMKMLQNIINSDLPGEGSLDVKCGENFGTDYEEAFWDTKRSRENDGNLPDWAAALQESDFPIEQLEGDGLRKDIDQFLGLGALNGDPWLSQDEAFMENFQEGGNVENLNPQSGSEKPESAAIVLRPRVTPTVERPVSTNGHRMLMAVKQQPAGTASPQTGSPSSSREATDAADLLRKASEGPAQGRSVAEGSVHSSLNDAGSDLHPVKKFLQSVMKMASGPALVHPDCESVPKGKQSFFTASFFSVRVFSPIGWLSNLLLLQPLEFLLKSAMSSTGQEVTESQFALKLPPQSEPVPTGRAGTFSWWMEFAGTQCVAHCFCEYLRRMYAGFASLSLV